MDMQEIIDELQKILDKESANEVRQDELAYLETRVKMLDAEISRLRTLLNDIGINDPDSINLYDWMRIRHSVRDRIPF